MTKRIDNHDDSGDGDGEDVVNEYKSEEGSMAERMAIHNAIRGSRRAMQYYNFKSDVKEDVVFDLIDIDKITLGEPFQVKVRGVGLSLSLFLFCLFFYVSYQHKSVFSLFVHYFH